MNKKDVQAIVDQFPFERYGWVNLPYGLHTKGLDRSETRDIVLPKTLKGKSFLDVGSAYGYFCFEAEDLGASSVIGLESKPQRVERANLFKSIRNSKVEFLNKSVVMYRFQQKFDYILVLNVLHHLKENAKLVLDYLISITNEVLVIETPALKIDLDKILSQSFNIKKIESSLIGPEKGSRHIFLCER